MNVDWGGQKPISNRPIDVGPAFSRAKEQVKSEFLGDISSSSASGESTLPHDHRASFYLSKDTHSEELDYAEFEGMQIPESSVIGDIDGSVSVSIHVGDEAVTAASISKPNARSKVYEFSGVALGRLSHIFDGVTVYGLVKPVIGEADISAGEKAHLIGGEKSMPQSATIDSQYGIYIRSQGNSGIIASEKMGGVHSSGAPSVALSLREVVKQKVTLLESENGYVLLFRDYTIGEVELRGIVSELGSRLQAQGSAVAVKIINGRVYS